MAIPFATRCMLQMFRDSPDASAQVAYDLSVRALVSGKQQDIVAAAEAVRTAQPSAKRASPSAPTLPRACTDTSFAPLHTAALDSATECLQQSGLSVPFDAHRGREGYRKDAQALVFVAIAVIAVAAVAVFHAWSQRCLPS